MAKKLLDKIRIVSIPSDSNPTVSYTLTEYSDGTWWCSCPSYKFQRRPVSMRECKHSRRYKLENSIPLAA